VNVPTTWQSLGVGEILENAASACRRLRRIPGKKIVSQKEWIFLVFTPSSLYGQLSEIVPISTRRGGDLDCGKAFYEHEDEIGERIWRNVDGYKLSSVGESCIFRTDLAATVRRIIIMLY
jgi:hypothetical protein